MSNYQVFDNPPKCPICKTEMTKLKRYTGTSGAEWTTTTVSSSNNASVNLYVEKKFTNVQAAVKCYLPNL